LDIGGDLCRGRALLAGIDPVTPFEMSGQQAKHHLEAAEIKQDLYKTGLPMDLFRRRQ